MRERRFAWPLALSLSVALHGLAIVGLGHRGESGEVGGAGMVNSAIATSFLEARLIGSTAALPEEAARRQVARAGAAPPVRATTGPAAKTKPGLAPRRADYRESPVAVAEPDFYSARELDRSPAPRSAPDTDMLRGVSSSGGPMRLRLYVDGGGAVAKIEVLRAAQGDADAVERVKAMFYATAFQAGQRAGRDVPSYMDIEVEVARLAPEATGIRVPG